MKYVKRFEDFIKEGVIKKYAINKSRGESLVIESERKLCSLKEYLAKIGIKNENANDYVEYCYDIIIFLIRAKLYFDGYSSSGQGAHEAEISYLRLLGFSEKEVQFADQLRYFRNGILYYGTRLDKEYAEKIAEFTIKNFNRLKKKII